jgi:hypothetical protein
LAKPFDIATKQIIDADPAAWLKFLKLPCGSAEVLNVDLSTSMEPDRLIQAHDPLYVQNTEIFSTYKADWVERMLPYHFGARYRFKQRVKSTAVLLRPEADGPLMTGRIQDEDFYFQFQVVRLWEVPLEDILSGPPSLLPLAVVSRVNEDDLPSLLGEIRERTQAQGTGLMDAAYSITTTLLGLTYEAGRVKELVRGVWNMPEWVLDSSIVKEAMAEGEARGKAEGKAEGKEEIIEILLKQRFSTLPAGTTARLDALTTDQMNDLAAALLSFSTLADLDKWLATR